MHREIRYLRKEFRGNPEPRQIVSLDRIPLTKTRRQNSIIGAIGRRADFKNQMLLVRLQYDAPVGRPTAESGHLKRLQCGFDSHPIDTFIAQWTEHKSSKLGTQVRFLLDVHVCGEMANTTRLERVGFGHWRFESSHTYQETWESGLIHAFAKGAG